MSSSTTPQPNNNNDEDLDDLLQEETANNKKEHFHLEMTPLNLDYLTKGQLDVVSFPSKLPPRNHLLPYKKRVSASWYKPVARILRTRILVSVAWRPFRPFCCYFSDSGMSS